MIPMRFPPLHARIAQTRRCSLPSCRPPWTITLSPAPVLPLDFRLTPPFDVMASAVDAGLADNVGFNGTAAGRKSGRPSRTTGRNGDAPGSRSQRILAVSGTRYASCQPLGQRDGSTGNWNESHGPTHVFVVRSMCCAWAGNPGPGLEPSPGTGLRQGALESLTWACWWSSL